MSELTRVHLSPNPRAAQEVKVLLCSSALSPTFPGTMCASHTTDHEDLVATSGAQASVSYSTEDSVPGYSRGSPARRSSSKAVGRTKLLASA